MVRFLDSLGRFSARRPWLVIVSWLLVIVGATGLAQTSGGSFVNDFRIPGAESQRAADMAREHFPAFGAATADVVVLASDRTIDDIRYTEAMRLVSERIRMAPDVAAVDEPSISPDRKVAIVTVRYDKEFGELGSEQFVHLQTAAQPARDADLTVEFRGQAVDVATQPETSSAELLGVGTALLVLTAAFGSVVAAGLPLLMAIFGIALGTALVLIAGAVVDIPTSAPIVAVMLGLGAGIDYALFVISAFRRHLAAGDDRVVAAGKALAVAGHAVVFAGSTVVVAILGLMLAGIPFVGAMGIAAALTVAVMIVAALTLLPAMLGLLGDRVNRLPLPRLKRRRDVENHERSRPAERWATHVHRHRIAYAAFATVVLLALTSPLLALRLGTPDDGTQPTDLTQRRAYEIVTDHFGPGANAPMLLVMSGTDEDVMGELRSRIATDEDVAEISPLLHSEDGDVAMMTVFPKHAPQDEEVTDLAHRIRDVHVPSVASDGDVALGGYTALTIDAADIIGDRLPWVILAVVVAGTLLLTAMFRAPIVAVKAALMTLLSIGAAFGVIVAMFQWGWGIDLVGIDKPVPIMSMVPMLLFAILFGLSMDYEVFLLSSIREALDESGDVQGAIRSGLSSTARIITAAALIMASVFLAFVFVQDTLVKMIGVGLAVAVLVDATIIRMILVPAVMSFLGKTAWWPLELGRTAEQKGSHRCIERAVTHRSNSAS